MPRPLLIGLPFAGAVALFLLGRYLAGQDLEVADQIASVLGLFLNLAALTATLTGTWLAWQTWRDSRTSGTDPADLGAALDALADAVRREWRDEENIRRVHDPHQLAVRVVPADDWLQDHDENIGGTPFPAATELDGIAALYAGIPTGRLVVLGRAGAGKSVLLIRLVLDLIKVRRYPKDPVPVLLPILTWDPAEKSLHAWFAEQLGRAGHPSLRGLDCRDLLRDGLLIPVLDGFDELREGDQAAALRAINQGLGPGMPVVLTSRVDEYVDAVTAGDVLTGALVRRLDDLTPGQVHRYLPLATRKPVNGAPGKWDAVLVKLAADPTLPLSRALSTPLMVSLARTAYSETEAEPATLLDRTLYPDATRIQEHLLDAYVESVYTGPSPTGLRIGPERARDALESIAAKAYDLDSDGFGWWRLPEIPQGGPYRLLVVTAGALLGAATQFLRQDVARLDFLLCAALGALIAALFTLPSLSMPPRRLPDRLRPALLRTVAWFAGAFLLCFAALTGFQAVVDGQYLGDFLRWVMTSEFLWLMTLLVFYASQIGVALMRPAKAPVGITPRSVLVADRTGALILLVAGTLPWCVLAVLLFDNSALVTVVAAPVVAVILIVGHAWPRLLLMRGYSAVTGAFPWRAITFLEDAHLRGVLRQAGATYQFRHALLRDRLIARAVAARQPPVWAEVTTLRDPSPGQRRRRPVLLNLQRRLRLIRPARYHDEVSLAWGLLGHPARALAARAAAAELDPAASARERSMSRFIMSTHLEDAGRLDESDRALADLLDDQRKRLGPGDPLTMNTCLWYTSFLIRWGQRGRARTLFQGVLDDFVRLYGPHHPRTLKARFLTVLTQGPQLVTIEAELQQLLRENLAYRPVVVTEVVEVQAALATLHRRAGRPAEAEAVLTEAIRMARRTCGDGHPKTLSLRAMLVRTRHDLGTPAAACAAEMETLRRRLARRLGPDHPEVRAAATYAAHLSAIS